MANMIENYPIFNQRCKNFHLNLQLQHERDLNTLEEGTKVIAKHKNTRYYMAEVLEHEEQVFYEVDFDDGSFSNDLYPEDIHVRSCT